MADDVLLLSDTPRMAGAEPLPGYRLLAPLGRGGFGEVWKCEAPGGLQKAIKFVTTGSDGFRQELDAFQQIKAIRHPFLLTLERVEQSGGDLLMVMELADGQLSDRFRECRAAGQPGIPREELLGYLREAAEALDMMGAKYGLQHLDVKPENIFLVSGHAKVGDYGLVRRADVTGGNTAAGFTPKYTSPEVLTGHVDIRSDQYSLALVYVELLTGVFPYPARSANQMMLQHIQGTPDLGGLSATDRLAAERALSKDPAARFPTCLAFVRELTSPDRPGSSVLGQRLRHPADATAPLPQHQNPRTAGGQGEVPTELVSRSPTHRLVRPQDRTTAAPPPPPPVVTDPFADLHTVMPVARLHQPRPRAVAPPEVTSLEYAERVVRVAAQLRSAVTPQPKVPGEQVRFLSTMPVNMMPYKLVIVAEQWGLSARHVDFAQVVLRKEDHDPAAWPVRWGKSAPRGGYEVTINLPAAGGVEVNASARVFGQPDGGFLRVAMKDIPVILDQVRSQLQNLQERRVHPRHPFDGTIRLYPLFADGLVGRGSAGQVIDVSLGGVRFVTPAEPESDRLYVEFPAVPTVTGQAVYMRLLRSHPHPDGAGVISVARFRRGE